LGVNSWDQGLPVSQIQWGHSILNLIIHEDLVNAFFLFLRLLLIYSHILKLVKLIENTELF